MHESSNLSRPTKFFELRRVASNGREACLENSATAMNREGSIPSLSASMLGCSWESRWLPNPSHGVRLVARVPIRKCCLMVWQEFAKLRALR